MGIKLGEICKCQSGGTPAKGKAEYFNGNIPWITTTALNGGKINESDAVDWITEKAIRESAAKIVPAFSIMVGTRVGVGKVAINTAEMSTSQDIISLIGIDETVWSKNFLCKFLQGKSAYLNSQARGATIKGIKIDVLAALELPAISLEEQQHISAVIDATKHIISSRRCELQKLDELIKARFVEMFDGKYPEDTLLNLCNIIDYRGKTPEKVESGLPFITAKNVKMHHMTFEPREYISKETYDKVMVRGFPKEGDVVFTTEAPLGNVCRIPYFDTEFYIGQRIVTMQTEELNPIYLEYALSDDEFVRKYMGKSSGSTVTGIRVRLLEQLTIPVPPRALQDAFAVFVEQVDKSKVAVQAALDKAQLLFDSLMQEYFG